MKRIALFLMALVVIVSISNVMPVASAADDSQFGITDLLEVGKEYVMVFNSNKVDNSGDRHPVYVGGGGRFGLNKISQSKFKGDNLFLDSSYSSYVWIAEEGPSNNTWRFKNAASGFYLAYDTEADYGLIISETADNDSTVWKFRKHTNGYCLHPNSDSGLRIYYDKETGYLELGDSSSSSYVYLYEKGYEACYEHEYDDCLDYTCNVCLRDSRNKENAAHTYTQDLCVCDVCGYERNLFKEKEISDDSFSTIITTVFGGVTLSKPLSWYQSQFEITSLISGVAPLEHVSKVDITVEANHVIPFKSYEPSCSVFFNSSQSDVLSTANFDADGIAHLSIDITDPESIDSIWLAPTNFEIYEEFLFRITVEVSHNKSSRSKYGEKLASVISFSDYQLSDSAQPFSTDWTGLSARLSHLLQAAGNKAQPDYIIFGGDYTIVENNAVASNMGRASVLSVIANRWPEITGDNGRYIQIQGNHDPDYMEGFVPSGPTEDENVIIYAIHHQDYKCWHSGDSSMDEVTAIATTLEEYLEQKIREGEKRPIIIATHVHLHYDPARPNGNTQYAYVLFDVINKVAEKLDIIYLFGHNHSSGDPEMGGGIVFRTRGDTINVSDPSCYDEEGMGYQDKMGYGRTSELNFTYMNFGYVGYILTDKFETLPAFEDVEIDKTQTVSEIGVYNDVITISRFSKYGRVDEYCHVIKRLHTENKPVIWPTIVMIGGGVLVIAVAVIVIIAISKKKKTAK